MDPAEWEVWSKLLVEADKNLGDLEKEAASAAQAPAASPNPELDRLEVKANQAFAQFTLEKHRAQHEGRRVDPAVEATARQALEAYRRAAADSKDPAYIDAAEGLVESFNEATREHEPENTPPSPPAHEGASSENQSLAGLERAANDAVARLIALRNRAHAGPRLVPETQTDPRKAVEAYRAAAEKSQDPVHIERAKQLAELIDGHNPGEPPSSPGGPKGGPDGDGNGGGTSGNGTPPAGTPPTTPSAPPTPTTPPAGSPPPAGPSAAPGREEGAGAGSATQLAPTDQTPPTQGPSLGAARQPTATTAAVSTSGAVHDRGGDPAPVVSLAGRTHQNLTREQLRAKIKSIEDTGETSPLTEGQRHELAEAKRVLEEKDRAVTAIYTQMGTAQDAQDALERQFSFPKWDPDSWQSRYQAMTPEERGRYAQALTNADKQMREMSNAIVKLRRGGEPNAGAPDFNARFLEWSRLPRPPEAKETAGRIASLNTNLSHTTDFAKFGRELNAAWEKLAEQEAAAAREGHQAAPNPPPAPQRPSLGDFRVQSETTARAMQQLATAANEHGEVRMQACYHAKRPRR